MSDPTSQLVSDKELELDDSKFPQIVSDVLHSLSDPSNSPSKHVDEELMLAANESPKISDQLQGFSSPLPMHSDEELGLVDEEKRQIVSDQLQCFSHPLEPPLKPLHVPHSFSDLSNPPSKHVDEELMLIDEEHQIVSDPPSKQLDEKLVLVDERCQIVSDQLDGLSEDLELTSGNMHILSDSSEPSLQPRDKELELDDSKCQQIVSDVQHSNPPSNNFDEEVMLIDEEHQIVSDPPSMQLDEKLMLVDDKCQIVSDHLDGLPEDLKLGDNQCQVASDHLHVLSDSSEPSLQPRDKELELDNSKCRQIVSDVLHSNPPSKHIDEEVMLIDEEHPIVSDPPSMQLDEKLMIVDEKCQIVSDQLDGLSEVLELTSVHVNILSDSSEPSLQPLDKKLELDDSKCRQIVSDVQYSNPPSKNFDAEVMLIDEENQIDSDPPSMQLDEKLMLVDDKCQLASDHLDGLPEDLKLADNQFQVASDHLHVCSDSSEPSLQPRDKELELDDSKCRQIVSDVLRSNPPSKHIDEEVMLIDEEHPIVSDPPSMQLDEKLMIVDEKCQIVSDHLDGLPEDLKLADNQFQVASGHVHVLSDSSEPSLQPLDEVETILEVDSHPLVEKGSQVKEVVLLNIADDDFKLLEKNKEKLALNFNDNVVDQVAKIMSDPSDLPLKDLDESKTVSQLHVLSDPSVKEQVCIDEEVMDFPPVNEVLNVDEVEPAPESTKEPAEVDNLEYCTFSLTNPRFSVILSHSQANYKYNLTLPGIIVRVLPQKKVPVVLNSYGKIWTMFYNGHLRTKTFNTSDWKNFVLDNELKVGDCCFFELLENSPTKIMFKVVVLKTDSSPSCDEEADAGESAEKPILVD